MTKERWSRRRFLKRSVAAGAGMLLGSKIDHDIRSREIPIITSYANIYINWQRHDLGNLPEEIPDGIEFDLAWRELSEPEIYTYEATDILSLYSSHGENIPIFHSDKLKRYAKEQTIVALGDIVIPEESYNASTLALVTQAVAGPLYIGAHRIRSLLAQDQGKEIKPIHRRTLLNLIVAWFSSAQLMGFFKFWYMLPGTNHLPITDYFGQVAGDMSQLHPEYLVLFFRNAVMAHKILSLTKLMSEQLGRKVNVYCEFGSAHAGIRRFLEAGSEVCLFAIQMFPTQFLQTVSESTGGIERMSGTRLISLDKTFDPSQDLDLMTAKTVRKGVVQSTIQIDADLMNMLLTHGVTNTQFLG